MTKPLREFWIKLNNRQAKKETFTNKPYCEHYETAMHVREVSKEYDAIVAEMVQALEKLDAGYSGMFGHEGVTAEQDAYETGLDIVKEALAKYNAFMKGREG